LVVLFPHPANVKQEWSLMVKEAKLLFQQAINDL
jgi:hypothetical protein